MKMIRNSFKEEWIEIEFSVEEFKNIYLVCKELSKGELLWKEEIPTLIGCSIEDMKKYLNKIERIAKGKGITLEYAEE